MTCCECGGRSRATGKVYTMTQLEVQATLAARVLIHPGTIHSLDAHSFVCYANVRPMAMRGKLAIALPTRDILVANIV